MRPSGLARFTNRVGVRDAPQAVRRRAKGRLIVDVGNTSLAEALRIAQRGLEGVDAVVLSNSGIAASGGINVQGGAHRCSSFERRDQLVQRLHLAAFGRRRTRIGVVTPAAYQLRRRRRTAATEP